MVQLPTALGKFVWKTFTRSFYDVGRYYDKELHFLNSKRLCTRCELCEMSRIKALSCTVLKANVGIT